MGRRHTGPERARGVGRTASEGTVHDERWAGEARAAAGCAALLLALLLVVDASSGNLTGPLAAAWTALAALLFAILMPARLSAREGHFSSRGLFRERSVRTDRLVSVHWSDGVAQRLVLRDTEGHRLELDPRALSASPRLWYRLDADARTSVRRGTLTSGTTALLRLTARVDGETARLVFRTSDLE